MAGEQSYEHLADRGGGDPAPRRIGDDAAFNLDTIGLILMIVGASVVSCPSCSGFGGPESVVAAAIGGSAASRATAQVDTSKRAQRHVELAVARARNTHHYRLTSACEAACDYERADHGRPSARRDWI